MNDIGLPPRMRLKHGGYYFDSYAKGQPRKWIFIGNDLRVARLRWAAILNKSSDAAPLQAGSMTFSALHDKFIAESLDGLAESTKAGYTINAAVLNKQFGDAKLSAIVPQHIALYLETHPKKTSANAQIMLMGLMFEKAMRWGWTTTNPCRGIRRNKIKRRDVYVTDAEFIAARAIMPAWVAAAMDIAYVTSLRVSDVLKLRMSDIHDDGLHVVHKKTGKRQIFEMTDSLRAAIDAAKATQRKVTSLFVISRRNGQPFDQRNVGELMRYAFKKHSLKSFHFHDIRAKAATDAERKGLDYFKMLGHADKAMSERYVKARKVDVVKSGLNIL